ncbi:MAG TPA: tandem-95 repeat protein [Haliangiales bacterium]|nr:tandem-95 repeat protein [Haliangiales bacterium]
MRSKTTSWTLVACAWLVACTGGSSPDEENPPCGPGGTCPAGQECSPIDNVCYASGLVPVTTIVAKPPPVTASASATFDFSATNGATSYECRVDAAAFAACTHPLTIVVPEGSHTFAVRAIGAHGLREKNPPSYTWTVDLTPPSTAIVVKPASVTRDTGATFTFSASETATFECSLDGAAYVPCPASYVGLAEGSHTLRVRAVDAAGNVDATGAFYTWTIDRTGPSPTITSGPREGAVSGRDVTFAFTVEAGGTYACMLDARAPVDCSAGSMGYAGLAGGSHTFSVVGTDAVGNAGTAVTRTWNVNALGPTVTVTGGPAPNTTSGGNVTFAYTASTPGSTFECALDAGAFAGCGPSIGFSDLGEGPHTFHVRATDPQQNVGGETTVTWSVDRTAPSVTLTYPPEGATTPSTLMATWTGGAPGDTFRCQLDAGAPADCVTPWTLAGLAGGAHTFVLTAIDAVGNGVMLPARHFNVNDPPTLAAISDQTGSEDTPLVVAITIGDGQTAAADLVVTATGDNAALVPDGAIVVGGSGAGRTLTIFPAANASGTATIVVSVSDGQLVTQKTFRLTIAAVNDAPTIGAIGPQSTTEGRPTAPIAVSVADVDTPAASLVLSGRSNNQMLVPDASIVFGGSGASRTVTITPAPLASGSATITVTVSDGSLSASTTFVLTVGAVDNPPTISNVADQTVAEDGTLGPVAFTIGDPDTAIGALTVSARSDNQTLVPDGAIALGGGGADRTVTIVPAANANGQATITLSVSDGTSTTSDTFVLTVTPVNDAPTMAAIADQTTNEDTAKAVTVTIDDVDTPVSALTLSGTSSNGTLLPNASITFGGTTGTRTATLTPAANQSGTTQVTLTVSDGSLTASRTFTLAVSAVNDPPTMAAIGDQTTAEDTPKDVTVTIDDIDTALASLTLSGTSSDQTLLPNANITFSGTTGTRTAHLAPAANQSGTATITLTVSDGQLTASRSFSLTVTAVNDPPTISAIADQTTTPSTAVGPIAFTVGDVETSPSLLTLSATSSNANLVPIGNISFGGSGAGRTVTVTPTAMTGTSTIGITVTDAGGATASTSFLLTVQNPATVPVATSASPASGGSTVVSFCGQAACDVPPGTSVTITATKAQNFGFLDWTGSSCPANGSTSAAFTFTTGIMAVSCQANFYRLWSRTYGGATDNPDSFARATVVAGQPVVVGTTRSFGQVNEVLAAELDPATGTPRLSYRLGAGTQSFQAVGVAQFGGSPAEYVVLGAFVAGAAPINGEVLAGTKLGLGQSNYSLSVAAVDSVGMVSASSGDGSLLYVAGQSPRAIVGGPTYQATRVSTFAPGPSPRQPSVVLANRYSTQCPGACCTAPSSATPAALVPMSDGGVVVITNSTTSQSFFTATRLTASGAIAWSNPIYNPDRAVVARAAVASPDGASIVVVGEAGTVGAHDFLWANIRTDGSLVWSIIGQNVGAVGADETALDVVPYNNGYAIVGTSAVGGNVDGVLLTIDGGGKLKATQAYGGSLEDDLNAVVAPPSGGLVVAGRTATAASALFGERQPEAWAMRVDETGVVAFDTPKNGMTSRAYPMTVGAAGETAVTTCPATLAQQGSDLSALATTFVSQALRLASLLL